MSAARNMTIDECLEARSSLMLTYGLESEMGVDVSGLLVALDAALGRIAAVTAEKLDLARELAQYRRDFQLMAAYAMRLKAGDDADSIGAAEAALRILREREIALAQVKIMGRALTDLLGATIAAQESVSKLTALAANIADRAEIDVINASVDT